MLGAAGKKLKLLPNRREPSSLSPPLVPPRLAGTCPTLRVGETLRQLCLHIVRERERKPVRYQGRKDHPRYERRPPGTRSGAVA